MIFISNFWFLGLCFPPPPSSWCFCWFGSKTVQTRPLTRRPGQTESDQTDDANRRLRASFYPLRFWIFGTKTDRYPALTNGTKCVFMLFKKFSLLKILFVLLKYVYKYIYDLKFHIIYSCKFYLHRDIKIVNEIVNTLLFICITFSF